MKFEVYCDEANPDVLTSERPGARYLMIGSLWLNAEHRLQIKERIQEIRLRHKTWGEIKWSKISPSRLNFYFDLVDLFLEYEKNLRFRCIAVDHKTLNLEMHGNDGELGFYKFYYQMLHHWISGCNEFRIFCDIKSNRDPKRLPVLERCLTKANLLSTISSVQSLPSHEVVLIQFCDLLLGAASSRLNEKLNNGTAKEAVVIRLEKGLGHRLMPTPIYEGKFNVFKIRLAGGQ